MLTRPPSDAPTPELYSALKAVDPVIAARWHPNDRRKIRRSLEIYYSMGGKQTASELYAAQRAAKVQPAESAPQGANDRNLIFWVHAETDVLRARLDARVDKMIEGGMWQEIEEMEKLYSTLKSEGSLDLNSGIWQSIGFKEFLPYLEMQKSGAASHQEMEEERNKAIVNMKAATRQYAKTQVRWVRIKFLNALHASQQALEKENDAALNGSSIFLMDSTEIPKYEENVIKPALTIARGMNFMNQIHPGQI